LFRKYKDLVFEIFKEFEKYGGKEVYLEIKKKIPSYTESNY
jgi:hypothetical protein